MINISPLRRRTIHAPCTVEIEHSAESLHAHVEIDSGIEIRPGDQVLVNHAPTDITFGESKVTKCMATIVRAGLVERIWTMFAGQFEITELYEVSFSDRRSL